MNKRRAKQEACFRSAMVIENALNGDWTDLDKYGSDRLKVEAGLREVIAELIARSGEPWEGKWVERPMISGLEKRIAKLRAIADLDSRHGQPVGDALRDACDIAMGLIRERDLAIAHDRQPYPTQWAYDQAVAALEAQRQRAERAEALVPPDVGDPVVVSRADLVAFFNRGPFDIEDAEGALGRLLRAAGIED